MQAVKVQEAKVQATAVLAREVQPAGVAIIETRGRGTVAEL